MYNGTTSIRNPLAQRDGLGRGVVDIGAGAPHIHLRKSFSRFSYLFRPGKHIPVLLRESCPLLAIKLKWGGYKTYER